MTWAMRHSLLVIAAVAAVSLLAASQLPRLEVAISPQSLIIEDDPDQQLYEDTLQTFGSDRITIVYLSDSRLFEPHKLEAIRRVVEAIEALPFVAKTGSLFNVPDIRVVDDLVTTAPILSEYPTNDPETHEVISRALQNPFVRGNLLAIDGDAMAINVYLKNGVHGDDLAFDAQVAKSIEEAIRPLTGVVEEFYQIGLPLVRSAIAATVADEQYATIGAALGALLLVLFIMFRRATALVVPAITAGLSIVWLLGAMAALEIPLSILTALVPVLLVIVGSTEDVHLLAETYDGLRRGHSLRRAIRKTIRRLGLAIGLTFSTSCLGFLAVGANPIGMVREFGLVASSGLAINFLLTALLVPVLLERLVARQTGRRDWRGAALYENVSHTITRYILTYRGLVLILSTLTMGGLVYAASSLQVNNNILNYFAADSPIQHRTKVLSSQLAGLYTLQVVVDAHLDGAFERVAYLEELQKLQRFVADHPSLDHSMSFADYISLLNSAVNETGRPALPFEDDVVETLMLFVGPDDVKEYLSYDKSKARIVVRHGISESKVLSAVLMELETFIVEKLDPDLEVSVTGESVLTDNAVTYLTKGQMLSLGLIIAVIFAVTALLFVTTKAGFIATVINLFPIAALFGVMGVSGIPLDSATSMIAALAVGIGVDHTMHFMVRYNLHFSGKVDELTAVSRTIRDEARPIGAATVALAAGFGTLALSSFPPIFYFGILSAMTMLCAFVATFVLAPVLLSYVRLTTIWEVLGTRVQHELQQRCALFAGMSVLQIRRIILLGRVWKYAHGETIMSRGAIGSSIFVLLHGNVAIESMRRDGAVNTVEVAGTGDVFGIAALMCGKPRVATARAIGSTEVLALNWGRLQRIARFFPRSAYRLFRNLSVITGERLADRAAAPQHQLPGSVRVVGDQASVNSGPVPQTFAPTVNPSRWLSHRMTDHALTNGSDQPRPKIDR